MKSKYILTFFLCFICYGQLFAMGSEEKEIKYFREMLENHPDFVCIERYSSNKDVFGGSNDAFISVNLTNNKKISFQYVDKNGGGKFANVKSIGDYQFLDYAKDSKKDYVSGAFFIDLSYIFGKEINTITDVIDNYDLILDYAKRIVAEELSLGTEKMKILHVSWDFSVISNYAGFYRNENIREAKVFVGGLYGPWNKDWEKYLPKDFWEDE